jgi:ribonuclease HI
MEEDETHIYTDGSASIKHGDGAWAFVIIDTKSKESVAHCARHDVGKTGEMEITAVLRALQFAHLHPSPLRFFCDSKYAINAVSVFPSAWKRNGWLTSVGQPVKNQEIIMEADRLLQKQKTVRTVSFHHVKGHSGIKNNELVDLLAGDCRRKYENGTWSEDLIKPYAKR